MKCPWCGSPVMIRGNRWECGYCGDSGLLVSEQAQASEPEEITLTFSVSFETKINFAETWQEMKDVLQAVSPQHYEELLPRLRSAFLYEISYALSAPGHATDEEKFHALDQFLQSSPDFRDSPKIQDIIDASKYEAVLCEVQGKLTEDFCGTFWQALIAQITDENKLVDAYDFFYRLGDLYEYFVSDEPDGQAYDRRSELTDALETHWYYNRYFHPDAIAATVRLCNNDTSCIDDDCRDILVSAFPDYFRNYSLDEIQDVQWDYLLRDILNDDPQLAVSMWETILNAAGPDFSMNQDVGEYLLSNSPFTEDD